MNDIERRLRAFTARHDGERVPLTAGRCDGLALIIGVDCCAVRHDDYCDGNNPASPRFAEKRRLADIVATSVLSAMSGVPVRSHESETGLEVESTVVDA